MKSRSSVTCLLACALLSACGSRPNADEVPEPTVAGTRVSLAPQSPQLAELATATARSATPAPLRLNGRLAWNENATVRLYSAFGGRVSKVDVEIGQSVHKGDVLARIASPDYGQAEADAHRAASDLRLAERTAARARDLFEHGATSHRELDAAEADLERARAEQERTVARLAAYGGSAGTVDGSYALRAPIDGEVVERNLTAGQEVRPDQILAGTPALTAPLFVITDPSRLWVVLDVNEHDAPKVHSGQPCSVRPHLSTEADFQGTIESVSQSLDPTTRTVKARASLANDQRQLRAEMLVTIEVSPPSDKVVQEVPSKAVFLEGEKHFLFVESARGQFERTEVQIGPEHDGLLQVETGLDDARPVVTRGALLLEKIYQDRLGS
ncbi:MAG: efflux RND transporter periplasmic adaptor subunit [Myxococcota bacterium]